MRPTAISLSALIVGAGLLISVGAQAATTQGYPVPEATKIPSGAIQLAGSFHNSPNKGGDKLLSGQAGSRYGIGGSEPKAKYFKDRMKKIPRCCEAHK